MKHLWHCHICIYCIFASLLNFSCSFSERQWMLIQACCQLLTAVDFITNAYDFYGYHSPRSLLIKVIFNYFFCFEMINKMYMNASIRNKVHVIPCNTWDPRSAGFYWYKKPAVSSIPHDDNTPFTPQGI